MAAITSNAARIPNNHFMGALQEFAGTHSTASIEKYTVYT
jgi:hypothetical protein